MAGVREANRARECGRPRARRQAPATRAAKARGPGRDRSAARRLHALHGPGPPWVFERGSVRIEAADGRIIDERSQPRGDLRSPRRLLWWDRLDLLYFGASSLWTYMAMPFIFTQTKVFYVGDDGSIRRHDYTAEEFGGWAKSAHYWLDYHPVDGLIVPRMRRVLPRRSDGHSRGHPLLVWINVHDVSRVRPRAQPSA